MIFKKTFVQVITPNSGSNLLVHPFSHVVRHDALDVGPLVHVEAVGQVVDVGQLGIAGQVPTRFHEIHVA